MVEQTAYYHQRKFMGPLDQALEEGRVFDADYKPGDKITVEILGVDPLHFWATQEGIVLPSDLAGVQTTVRPDRVQLQFGEGPTMTTVWLAQIHTGA